MCIERRMLMEKFYTLHTYLLKNKNITYNMEDYIEMLYRRRKDKNTITLLSKILNIKKPSCSKMINKLEKLDLVYHNDNDIILTNKGEELGSYLLYRHETIETFLRLLNKEEFKFETVELIEHFIDSTTLKNLEKLISKLKKLNI